jgi:hypothetical protein
MIGEKYGMSTRGEQMKQLRQQGLLQNLSEPRYAKGGMVFYPKSSSIKCL